MVERSQVNAARQYFKPHIPRFAAHLATEHPELLKSFYAGAIAGQVKISQLKKIGGHFVKLDDSQRKIFSSDLLTNATLLASKNGPAAAVEFLTKAVTPDSEEAFFRQGERMSQRAEALKAKLPPAPTMRQRFGKLVTKRLPVIFDKLGAVSSTLKSTAKRQWHGISRTVVHPDNASVSFTPVSIAFSRQGVAMLMDLHARDETGKGTFLHAGVNPQTPVKLLNFDGTKPKELNLVSGKPVKIRARVALLSTSHEFQLGKNRFRLEGVSPTSVKLSGRAGPVKGITFRLSSRKIGKDFTIGRSRSYDLSLLTPEAKGQRTPKLTVEKSPHENIPWPIKPAEKPPFENIPRQIKLKKGVIGVIPFDEVAEDVEPIKSSRSLRSTGFAYSAAAAVAVPVAHFLKSSGHLNNPWTKAAFGALLLSGVGAGIASVAKNVDIRQKTTNLALRLMRHKKTLEYLRKGATHLFVNRSGDVHFIKAPKYKGKPFRPIIGRLRAPL